MLQKNNALSFQNTVNIDLEEVVDQLEKDLEMSGNKYVFMKKHAEELIVEFADVLMKIDHDGKLESLFYRIDFNVSKLKAGANYYNSLSLAIWNRILQKVWFRKNY